MLPAKSTYSHIFLRLAHIKLSLKKSIQRFMNLFMHHFNVFHFICFDVVWCAIKIVWIDFIWIERKQTNFIWKFSFIRYDFEKSLSFLSIWNIYFQNFAPVAVPSSDHGKFFTGDSYIILNVSADIRLISCKCNSLHSITMEIIFRRKKIAKSVFHGMCIFGLAWKRRKMKLVQLLF